jgi:ethanolamine ammonia-lyase small subunit
MTPSTPPEIFVRLRQLTQARIGLGRAGNAVPTVATLAFQLDHARARDAVHQAMDSAAIAEALAPMKSIIVRSQAADRTAFLRRPDLGRRLDPVDVHRLERTDPQIAFVIADGLSAGSVANQAAALIHAVCAQLPGRADAPVIIAHQGRVGLGDEIGALLNAQLVAVLIGERPGLSACESMGIYLTFQPRIGRLDSERNCISNIRDGGVSIDQAAGRLLWLMKAALALQATGIELKDGYEARAPDQLAPQGSVNILIS